MPLQRYLGGMVLVGLWEGDAGVHRGSGGNGMVWRENESRLHRRRLARRWCLTRRWWVVEGGEQDAWEVAGGASTGAVTQH